MLAICQARTDLPTAQCMEIANIFFLAVSTTSIATDIFRRSQYFASSCACRQLPTPPSNLMAQVSSGAAGGQVSLQWTASTDATSYQVEVVQPALAPIDTNSPIPGFMAAGVPNGQYRLQVRGVNPLGASAPSNIVDVVVGSGTPCAPPSAPTGVSASLSNGTATVSWSAVAGATSYIVRAGSVPGGSISSTALSATPRPSARADCPPGSLLSCACTPSARAASVARLRRFSSAAERADATGMRTRGVATRAGLPALNRSSPCCPPRRSRSL